MQICNVKVTMEKNGSELLTSCSPAKAMRESTDSNPSEVKVERRKKPRIYTPFHARVSGVNSSGEAFEASTVLDNMSSGGLYLRVEHDVTQGTQVVVTIRLSTKHIDLVPVANVAVKGVVLRNEEQMNGTYGLGISIHSRRFVS
jgi:c-di-GMP-binding flagellar brake protein YcgR